MKNKGKKAIRDRKEITCTSGKDESTLLGYFLSIRLKYSRVDGPVILSPTGKPSCMHVPAATRQNQAFRRQGAPSGCTIVDGKLRKGSFSAQDSEAVHMGAEGDTPTRLRHTDKLK